MEDALEAENGDGDGEFGLDTSRRVKVVARQPSRSLCVFLTTSCASCEMEGVYGRRTLGGRSRGRDSEVRTIERDEGT